MPSATLADDSFHRITELLDMSRGSVMLEGFLSADTNGLTFRVGDQTQPADSAPGTVVAASGSAGFGPASSREVGWPLDTLWVRNATAGSNAVVVLNPRLA